MTCSSCKTLFEYSTGREGGHGSHNENFEVKNENRYRLSSRLKNS